MAQVKFYRGLVSAYNPSDSSVKDGIFFSMDEKVIYHNGVKFGGIDPQYFSGVTKNFDIEGSQVTFKKLNSGGTWDDVTINLVEAFDKSIVIGDLANDNDGSVTDGFTVKVNVKNVNVGDDGLKLDNTEQGGLYVDFSNTKAAIKANKDAIDVLNGGATDAGSVTKSIKDAIDGLNFTAIGGDGKVIATVSQNNGKVSATTIDLTAGNVAATASSSSATAVAVEGETVADQISSLATSIKSVSSAAKSYSIASITGDSLTELGTNVKEAYQLVDEGGAKAGEVIKIYKDSSLKSVELKEDQKLYFTYILSGGTENTVVVDTSKFLAESEFKDGLSVNGGLVKVKIAEGSEDFLTVGESGVKLSGVQDAIDEAAASATTKVEKDTSATHITLESATSTTDGSVTYTIGQNDIASAALLGTSASTSGETSAFGYIAKEVANREAAIAAQTTALNAEIAARKAVDGISGDTYTANTDAKYISGATSLFDADVKLNEAIKEVANTAANAHTVVNAKADGHVKVTVAKSSDKSHDVVTVTENDIASADALTAETADRQSADEALSNRLGAGVTSAYTATAQFTDLKGSTTSNSGDTSIYGAKKYADVKIDEAVKGLNVDAIGKTGHVIATVSQADGKVSATTIELKAENVAATAIEASDEVGKKTVAVEGETVAAQVESLAKSIKSVADTLLWIDCGNYQA